MDTGVIDSSLSFGSTALFDGRFDDADPQRAGVEFSIMSRKLLRRELHTHTNNKKASKIAHPGSCERCCASSTLLASMDSSVKSRAGARQRADGVRESAIIVRAYDVLLVLKNSSCLIFCSLVFTIRSNTSAARAATYPLHSTRTHTTHTRTVAEQCSRRAAGHPACVRARWISATPLKRGAPPGPWTRIKRHAPACLRGSCKRTISVSAPRPEEDRKKRRCLSHDGSGTHKAKAVS